MANVGRLLVLFGLGIAALGCLFWIGGRVVDLGRLPGDLTLRRGTFTLYFPLTSSLLVSLLLTLLLNLLFWRR
jgi:hypothetical protein